MEKHKKDLRQWLGIYARGIAMGAADVVPGVSGGTVAFIAGIYERLINAIAAVTKTAFPAFRKEGVRGAWRAIDGWFLVTLGAGIVTSFLLLAKGITWMLAEYPQLIWSFFFGLVLASSLFLYKLVKSWRWTVVGSLVVAFVATFWITSAAPTTTPDTLPFIFLSGMIAISAMILPGISGSFMLVLMGKYGTMLEALDTFNIVVIVTFIAGCAIGIATASRVIGWLFRSYHDVAVATIVGIMVGSLNKVWPWKQTLTWRTTHSGGQEPLFQKNVLPHNYEAVTGSEPYTLIAIGLMVLGIALILVIEWYGKRQKIESEKTA